MEDIKKLLEENKNKNETIIKDDEQSTNPSLKRKYDAVGQSLVPIDNSLPDVIKASEKEMSQAPSSETNGCEKYNTWGGKNK